MLPIHNIGVITKLTHEVLDLLADTPNVDSREVEDAVNRRCQLFGIACSRDVITCAIDSAVYQRRRAGKPTPPGLRGCAGDAAFRLQRAHAR